MGFDLGALRDPRLLWLSGVWILWGVLHSLLIAGPVRRALERGIVGARGYRLFYNAFAVATLVPVYIWSRILGGGLVFDWWGASEPVALLFLVAAMALFIAGARQYDVATFLGTRQLTASGIDAGLTESGALSREGVLGVVRHPWYAGGLLVLWAGSQDAAEFVTAVVLSVYLVTGAYVEEGRLLRQFGEDYRRYRREVSMFFPFRWVRG